jgi:hypothetical protein
MSIAPSLMTVTSRITAQAASPEHPANGVERGFVDLQDVVLAAHRLDALAARWPERKLLNVAVLRALLLLVQREPGQAEEGFDAWAIAAAVGTVIGRKWATGDTAGRDLRQGPRALAKAHEPDLAEEGRGRPPTFSG